MFIQNFTCFSTSIFLSKNRQGNVNSFCIVQFSRSFLNSVAVISFRRLCYYITSFRVCQEVFKTFFKVFFKPSRFALKKRLSFRKLLYYITFSWVCQEVFKTFFKVFCDLFAFVVPSSRVLVYYITFIDKSQHFFEKFFSFVTYALYN